MPEIEVIEDTSGAVPDKTEKSYSPEEVSKIVQARLAKTNRLHEVEIEAKEAELTALRAEKKARESALEVEVKAEVEQLKESVDPAILDLLPEKLSIADQRDWLKKASVQVPSTKGKMPVPPKGKQTPKDFEVYPVEKMF
jgi:hypothetical protein